MKKRHLVLGDGLLGKELVKQTGWDYISRKKDMMDLKDIVYFFWLCNVHILLCTIDSVRS